MFLQCVSTVIIVYIIISPLNSYLYVYWILDFKSILLLLLLYWHILEYIIIMIKICENVCIFIVGT